MVRQGDRAVWVGAAPLVGVGQASSVLEGLGALVGPVACLGGMAGPVGTARTLSSPLTVLMASMARTALLGCEDRLALPQPMSKCKQRSTISARHITTARPLSLFLIARPSSRKRKEAPCPATPQLSLLSPL